MKLDRRFFSGVLSIVIGLGLLAGCWKKDDPIVQAEKKDADKPGILAIKDIAKEAYIYDFPMVMNYGVMHAYFVDQKSGQYKAPFNTIYNEACADRDPLARRDQAGHREQRNLLASGHAADAAGRGR